MDLMSVGIKFLSGFILGGFSGLVWPGIREKIARKRTMADRRRRKLRALTQLDDLASEIQAAVKVKPHGILNKEKWVQRINMFTEQNLDWLEDLSVKTEKIGWRIEDSSFDHSDPNCNYCCNEVITDLRLLKLAMLPHLAEAKSWDPEELEKAEREQIRRVFLEVPGPHGDIAYATGEGEPPIEAQKEQRAEEAYHQLKAGKLSLPGRFVMTSYFTR